MKLMRSTTLATMALTLLSALPLAGPASAQSVSHTASTVSTKTWSVQGALTIGKVAVIFPVGSRFTADYDANSGKLANGSLSVPESTLNLGGTSVTVKLQDLGDATGTLAPNGVATISESLIATMNISLFNVPCDIGPMAITVGTLAAGGSAFHGTPSTGTLVDPQFTAPRPTVAGQCTEEMANIYSTLPLPSEGSVTVTLTEILPTPSAIYEPVQRAVFPTGIENANPQEIFWAISCSTPGNCTAAGVFLGPDDQAIPMTQTSTNGVWAPAVPADVTGIAGSGSNGSFHAVSCTAPGYCTAAGEYNQRAITQTSTNGVWAPAVEANFTSDTVRGYDGPNDSFNSISCYFRGYCTAVGEFTSGDYRSPMTATSTNGVWGPVTPVNLPSSLDHEADTSYSQVSCSAPGFCTATGYSYSYADGFTNTFTSTSTMGVWGELVILMNTKIVALSCTQPGYCTGAGSYRKNGDDAAMTITMTAGAWFMFGPEAVYIDPAKESSQYPQSELTAISCTAPGYCTAVGNYSDANDNGQVLLTTSTQDLWSSVAVSNAQDSLGNSPEYPDLTAVSCSSPGNCTAAGSVFESNQSLAAILSQNDGVWSPFVVATLGSDVTSTPYSYFSSISCSGPTSCTAAGAYLSSDNAPIAMTLTVRPSGPPSAPVNTTAQAAPGHAIVSWQTPTNTYGALITEYRVTVLRGNAMTVVTTITVPASATQTVVALPVGSYSFSVVAVTANGVGASSTTSMISVPSSTPSAPVNTTAQAAPGHAIVSWQTPTNTYGALITEYRVTVLRGNAMTVVTTITVPASATQTVVALPVGSYSFSVVAVTSNGVGASAATSTVSVTSTKGVRVPPAPRMMPSKVADGQVALSWLPPVLSEGGAPIYQYVATDGQGHGCVVGTDARIAVNTFTCTVTGLTNGRVYGFTVQAVNIMGSSAASLVKYMRPASAPKTAPILSINSITPKRVTFDITAPSNMGGRELMYYRVSYNNGRTWTSLANFTSGDQVYLGLLKPNTTYHVLVSARNAIGAGPAASVTFKTARK